MVAPLPLYALALAAIATGWQYRRKQLKARSGNPFHTQDRGADRLAGKWSEYGPGGLGAGVRR